VPTWKGVIDHLDATDRILAKLGRDVMETIEPATIRKWKSLIHNARSSNAEARRMLERSGSETTETPPEPHPEKP
jgi:hypothetical protein